MAAMSEAGTREERFSRFAADVEPRLRRALVAWYGVEVGSEATADALEWRGSAGTRSRPWRTRSGYLFRVGQSRSRRYRRRAVGAPAGSRVGVARHRPPAARARSPVSRSVSAAAVLLVHAHGWTQTEAADALGCSVSTSRNHLDRGMRRLRAALGDDDA